MLPARFVCEVLRLDHRAAIMLYFELVFAFGLLWGEGLLKDKRLRAYAIAAVSFAFVLRYAVMTYETLDYQDWIRVWIRSLRDAGAWNGLGQEIWSCNYNVPYLYFLAVISKSEIYDLYLVKLVSIFFDVLLAFFTMRLVGLFHKSPARRLAAFTGVLFLPTVFLNGALWGQCDVIYAAFAVLGVYLALDDKPGWSVAAIAVSVSFKLQGVFLLPAYFAFFIGRKMRFRYFFIFPAVYILTILPAVLAGRSFWELLTLYYNNTSTIGDGLNYNSPSMYALFDFGSFDSAAASRIGILVAATFCVCVFVWLFWRQDDIDDRGLFGVCLLFCIGVPFFLPHMHDRYFFMADVLAFALAVIVPQMSAVPMLVWFGSLLGYHAYLKMRFLLPMRWGGAAMALALVLTFGFVIFSMESSKKVLTNDDDLV